MAGILTPDAYRKLVQEDLDWLQTVPRTLERDHIIEILKWQIANSHTVIAMCRELTKDDPKP